MGVINKNYQKNENTYTIKYIVLKIENDSYILNIENKTGKISYIAFGKNNLYDVDNKKVY